MRTKIVKAIYTEYIENINKDAISKELDPTVKEAKIRLIKGLLAIKHNLPQSIVNMLLARGEEDANYLARIASKYEDEINLEDKQIINRLRRRGYTVKFKS